MSAAQITYHGTDLTVEVFVDAAGNVTVVPSGDRIGTTTVVGKDAALVTREQAEHMAGSALTDEQWDRLVDSAPHSSIPDAISTIADSIRGDGDELVESPSGWSYRESQENGDNVDCRGCGSPLNDDEPIYNDSDGYAVCAGCGAVEVRA